MSANSTRGLAADRFQEVSTDIISLLSVLILVLCTYIVGMSMEKRDKYIHLYHHFLLFFAQFYVGKILCTVILFPVPAIYCLGWLKNATLVQQSCLLAILLKLFLVQGEVLGVTLFLKSNSVARRDSAFKLHPMLKYFIVVSFLTWNMFLSILLFYISHTPRDEVNAYVEKNYPYHVYLLRYNFLMFLTSNKLYISLIAILFCSVGEIIVVVFSCYVITLYEVERQEVSMSKSVRKHHKAFIDEVASHAETVLLFFLSEPIIIFVQFFVKEETDVSITLAIVMVLFVSTPIAAMLKFLWRNPTYRAHLLHLLFIKRNSPIRTTVQVSNRNVIRLSVV